MTSDMDSGRNTRIHPWPSPLHWGLLPHPGERKDGFLPMLGATWWGHAVCPRESLRVTPPLTTIVTPTARDCPRGRGVGCVQSSSKCRTHQPVCLHLSGSIPSR